MDGKCPMCGGDGKVGDMCQMCNVAFEEKCSNCNNAASKCTCAADE